MCGITVCWPANPSALADTLGRMQDRGPDRTAAINFATGSLGVVRLAITDVAGGHQPLPASDGTGAVAFNGAIYNSRELVAHWGLRPGTGNDGEVIWPLYRRFGTEFAGYLRGMFAIAIVDDDANRVVLAVDSSGIKPLYVASDADGSWFAASTVQALPQALRRSAFRVPAGTVMTSDGAVTRVKPQVSVGGSLRKALEVAVAEQIPTEVPWGCMLSGGLDSSIVTALAARHSKHVTTISVGLPNSSDLAAAARVANMFGTDHHEVIITEEELPALIEAAIRATASPDGSTVMGGVGTYAAARAAKRLGLKVLLSGEGADELFAGYGEYRLTPHGLLATELLADQDDLGATECLRLDRCTMAYSVEARVPYLDPRVVALARALPPEELLELSRPAEPRDKIALRRVADGLLPPDVAWRPKLGFSTSSGLMAAGEQLARRLLTDKDLARISILPGWAPFRRSQYLIEIDEHLAGLTFNRWCELYGVELGPWNELLDRGQARRYLSDGPYELFTPQSLDGPVRLAKDSAASLTLTSSVRKESSRPHGVLVLASKLHAEHPYAEWLDGLSGPLLAIAHEAAAPTSGGFTHTKLLSNWEQNAIVKHALALYRTCGFDRIIGLGEVDILSAARIREILDLPGQLPPSALAYRDKLKMRELAAAGGIRVPAFTPVRCPNDVARFIHHHGPVMVKPRLGGGSVGIRRVNSVADAADLDLTGDPGGYLVEAWVEGPLFHVEALRHGGKVEIVVPCAYTGDGCLSHWTDTANGSWTLAPSNPLYRPLVEATSRLLEAFPGPQDLAIHAEWILSGDDLVLCEVASRCGGDPIPSMIVRYLGADMRHLWSRIQCGLPVDWGEVRQHAAKAPLVANLGIPPRDGHIEALPDWPPPGVQDLMIRCSLGEDFSGLRYDARRSGDFVATWIVEAVDEPALLREIDATVAAIERQILWESHTSTPRHSELMLATH